MKFKVGDKVVVNSNRPGALVGQAVRDFVDEVTVLVKKEISTSVPGLLRTLADDIEKL